VAERPPSLTDLARRAVSDQRRSSDRYEMVRRWREAPLTVGLLLAIIAGASWSVSHLVKARKHMMEDVRHEIANHSQSTKAHAERFSTAREAWRSCLELERRVGAIERRLAEEPPKRRRRRR
jgi:hypothetical protein